MLILFYSVLGVIDTTTIKNVKKLLLFASENLSIICSYAAIGVIQSLEVSLRSEMQLLNLED